MPGQCFMPHSAIVKLLPTNVDYTKLTGAELMEMIDPSALELVTYRIPNQGMSSNDAMEIVGILPPEMGDSIIAYDGVPAKTGSDFDIDKMYVMMHHLELVDGKIKKIASDGDSKKAKQNKLVDLYKTVLTSPHTYDAMMTSIDAEFFKKDIVGLFPEEDMGDLQLMGPTQQIKTKFEYISGKFGVAQTANQLVDHVLNQSLNIRLDGYLGIGFKDDDGNTKFDNIMDFEGKNSIADVLSAFLNAYVDIAKDPYISRGNHNSVTSGVAFMLIRAGAPIDWVNRFIGQPILKELVETMKMSEGITSEGLLVKGKKADAYEFIRDRYKFPKAKGTSITVASLSKTKMKDTIKGKKSIFDMGPEDANQNDVLDAFEFLLEKSKAFSASVSAGKADTKGGGGDFMDMFIQANKVAEVEKKGIILGFMSKFDGTMLGTYQKNAVDWIGEVVDRSNIFLSASEGLQDTFNQISMRLGKGLLKDKKLASKLDASYYSYAMSSMDLFKDNNASHQELFKNLPETLLSVKDKTNNFLVQELEVKDSDGYSFIGLNSKNKTKTYENRIYRAWMDLLRSDNPKQVKFGKDLARYAYSQSGFQNNLNQFFTHIPHELFAEERIDRVIADMFDKSSSVQYDDKFRDQLFRHSAEDVNIVHRVSLGNVINVDKTTDLDTAVVYNTMSASNSISIGKNEDDINAYPEFISMKEKKGDNINLYQLIGARDVKLTKGSTMMPFYVRTHKLGLSSNKGKVFEYSYKNDINESIVKRNNLNNETKKSIAKIIANLEKNSTFVPASALLDVSLSLNKNENLVPGSKIIDDLDIDAYKKSLEKRGYPPEEWFTHSSLYTNFYNNETGKKGRMPQDHMFYVNDNGYYDMVDNSTGEIIISNVDLKTGIQYLSSDITSAVSDDIDNIMDDKNLNKDCE